MIEKGLPRLTAISQECPELFDPETPKGAWNREQILGYITKMDFNNLKLELERLEPFYQAKVQKRLYKRRNPHDL